MENLLLYFGAAKTFLRTVGAIFDIDPWIMVSRRVEGKLSVCIYALSLQILWVKCNEFMVYFTSSLVQTLKKLKISI